MVLKKKFGMRSASNVLSYAQMKLVVAGSNGYGDGGGYDDVDYGGSSGAASKVCYMSSGIYAGQCVCGSSCSTNSQCETWYGSGSKCSCSYC